MPEATSDPYKVQEITHLKGKPRAAEALELLQRVALQVQPIMRKRQWTVRKLSEFIPKSDNLLGLNVNRGAEVKIRLRPPGQEDSFYSWNHVLGTMLHELCHNKIGPHNAAFYQLLDELWCDAEDFMDRGFTGTGQGFDAPAAGRLGAFSFIPMHNPPEHKMADVIRKAAEARAKKAAIMPAGPQKLGGSRSYKHMTPAQAAAAAAERRAHDNMWCGAEHTPEEVQQELGSADASPAASTAAAAAVAAVAAASSVGPSVAAAAASQSPAHGCKATATAAAAAGHAAVRRQQAELEVTLQQEWRARIQQQQRQRQQAQQQKAKKRSAAEAIDLTLSDDESDGLLAGHLSAAAAANSKAAVADGAGALGPCSCPCCHPGFAAAERLDTTSSGAASFRVWCARSRQWLQDQQELSKAVSKQLDPQPSAGHPSAAASHTAGASGQWVCPVCTLLNPAMVLQCEACLTERGSIG